jgi:glucans biosynthesis protein C
MERIAYIDNVRNTANFVRLFIHAGVPYMVTVTGMWPVNEIGNWFFDIVNFEGHLFVMELFFLVAGFMFSMQQKKSDLKAFISNRMNRIVIPFFLGMIILIPFILMLFGLGKYDAYDWFKSEIIIQAFKDGLELGMQNFFPTGHLWFLYYLILFYVVTLLIIRIKGTIHLPTISLGKYVIIACVSSFAAMLLSEKWIIENPLTLIPEITSFVHFFLFFIGGQLLYKHEMETIKYESISGKIIGFGFMIGLLSASCQLYFQDTQHEYYMLIGILAKSTYVISSYLLAYGAWFLIKKNFNRSSPLAQYFAKASYWIYLVNLPIVMFLHLMLVPVDISTFFKFIVVFILGVLLSISSYTLFRKVRWKLH